MKIRRIVYLLIVVILFISCASTEKAAKYPAMLANVDPFSLGFLYAQGSRNYSSKPSFIEMDVIFYPRQNEVALVFKHGASYFQQYWNQ